MSEQNKEDKKKVLIIDDEKGLLEDLVTIFEMEGLDVITANDGSQGIFKLENQSFDIVATDLNMPKTDGLGVIKSIRNNPKISHIPVIVLSGNIEKFKDQLEKLSNIYILEKPFKPADIKSIVSRALSRSEKELKLSSVLTPEILRISRNQINDVLGKMNPNIGAYDPVYGNGPYIFKTHVCAYQNYEINGIDGSVYFIADQKLASMLGETFCKDDEVNDATDKALRGMFFMARALGAKIGAELRQKKAKVKMGVPHVFGSLENPTSNIIEKTYRYSEVIFDLGDSQFRFIYKYN